jgi:hypothetical protein
MFGFEKLLLTNKTIQGVTAYAQHRAQDPDHLADNLFGHSVHLLRCYQQIVRISMDGNGRWIDNVSLQRLLRSVKYEDVYSRSCGNVRDLGADFDRTVGDRRFDWQDVADWSYPIKADALNCGCVRVKAGPSTGPLSLLSRFVLLGLIVELLHTLRKERRSPVTGIVVHTFGTPFLKKRAPGHLIGRISVRRERIIHEGA